MHAIRKAFLSEHRHLIEWMLKKSCSTAIVPVTELIEKRNYLFSQEQKKQIEEVGRIEKISVEVSGPPENVVMVMNQNISTPYDCCRHISQGLCSQSPLALVNEKILWDMHRPLPGNCSVKFLNFKDDDPFSLNKVFWRSGSFILGAVISRAFKDEVKVYLHSFPAPVVKSGSFVYDVIMNLLDWQPNEDELKVLSAEFLSFCNQNLKIERLQVKKSLALEIFEGNPLKQKQIPEIAAQAEDNLITLYRVGDHIDISCGPMVADTSFFGRCAVTAVHRICSMNDELYRFQAVALPKGIMALKQSKMKYYPVHGIMKLKERWRKLNPLAFSILRQRAERLNEVNPPGVKDPK